MFRISKNCLARLQICCVAFYVFLADILTGTETVTAVLNLRLTISASSVDTALTLLFFSITCFFMSRISGYLLGKVTVELHCETMGLSHIGLVLLWGPPYRIISSQAGLHGPVTQICGHTSQLL